MVSIFLSAEEVEGSSSDSIKSVHGTVQIAVPRIANQKGLQDRLIQEVRGNGKSLRDQVSRIEMTMRQNVSKS
jgi:hypothetical protein